jgi:hypothetical protein
VGGHRRPIGAADELPRTVLMTAAWVINLAVAEYVIRRRPAHRSNRTSAGLVADAIQHEALPNLPPLFIFAGTRNANVPVCRRLVRVSTRPVGPC